jgi:glucokinase
MILAGDIGGTNTRLALFEIRRGRLMMGRRHDARNAGHRGVVEIVRPFLEESSHPVEIACFGVAGPVKDGHVELTNLKWTLDERKLAKSLGIGHVVLINDLVAHAEGTNVLGPRELVALRKGDAVRGGNRAIVAPGTGLGEGGLVYDHHSDDYRAFPSEGGHSDFAPTNDREIALMRFVRTRLDRCDCEDVLSGRGLRNIFDFLASPGEFHVEPTLAARDPEPKDITAAANDGSCSACIASVELFAELCGAEAGNMALKILATGGVYIGGGIPPRVLKFFKRKQVMNAFMNKGPASIQKLLKSIPVHLIRSPDNALYGAAHCARRV